MHQLLHFTLASVQSLCSSHKFLVSMIKERKSANAVGGKTARACDSCLHKRARRYCGAHDAFLCQSCDASVHSANELTSRHDRVCLQTASLKSTGSEYTKPAWDKGFTRKVRTPRRTKPKRVQPALKDEQKFINSFPLVPEIVGEETSLDEEKEEEELLYRVPVFDPFDAELCNTLNEMEDMHLDGRTKTYLAEYGQNSESCDLDNLPGFLPSDDMSLLEFAADVECLLGVDEGSCGIEGLGLIDCKEEVDIRICFGNKVKIEDDEEVKAILACNLDLSRETLDWNFDYESSPMMIQEEEEEQKVVATADESESKEEMRRSILLRLNYEGVISAWANQGSPWTNGSQPELNPDDCWPDFMDICLGGISRPYGGARGSDGGREARVSRYREKRRTRLFSKKIRYEVRKLNAEKRPRMKGRFVKRASFAGGPAFPNHTKK